MANNCNMMLVTPQVAHTPLGLPPCPPPPRFLRSKLSYFHSMEIDGDNGLDPVVMFPKLPLYNGGSQSNEQPRTSNSNPKRYEMVLKPRPMYGRTSFARISPSPIRERIDYKTEEEAMPKASDGKASKESAIHSNLLGCLQNRRSSFSRAA